MPLEQSEDSEGYYYSFGSQGHKYYYNPRDSESEEVARNKALRQGRAIEWSKHRPSKRTSSPRRSTSPKRTKSRSPNRKRSPRGRSKSPKRTSRYL